jgi:hypothetical protein
MVNLSWLTGPIFDKELRVSSRRRRNYVLRSVYVALFLVFVSLIWIEEMPRGSAPDGPSSRELAPACVATPSDRTVLSPRQIGLEASPLGT